MFGISATTWNVLIAIRDAGQLFTVRGSDYPAMAFSCVEAAGRFARILTNVEETPHEVGELTGGALNVWLEAVAFEDGEVLIEPEYVHGKGVIGDRVPAGDLRSALVSAPAA